MTTPTSTDAQEKADFLETLSTHRSFMFQTVKGLTDEQARQRTTASELCLGGLVKHLTIVERNWDNFIVNGPGSLGRGDEASMEAHAAGFRMLDGETLAGLVEAYKEVARRTDELVASLPSLDVSQPLPSAPWFKPGPAGPRAAPCCTFSPRRPSMPDMPTSSGNPWTGPRPWVDRRRGEPPDRSSPRQAGCANLVQRAVFFGLATRTGGG